MHWVTRDDGSRVLMTRRHWWIATYEAEFGVFRDRYMADNEDHAWQQARESFAIHNHPLNIRAIRLRNKLPRLYKLVSVEREV